MRRTWIRLIVPLVAGVLSGCGEPPIPEATELRAANVAKALCTGIFVGDGGDSDGSTPRMLAPAHFPTSDLDHLGETFSIDISVDRGRQVVTATVANRVERVAVFHAGHGCTILPRGASDVLFDPVPVRSALPGASLQEWPMGNRGVDDDLPFDVDQAALRAVSRSGVRRR